MKKPRLNISTIVKLMLHKEIRNYSNTMSMILKASLSVRADLQDRKENNNYSLFNFKEAVVNTSREVKRDIFFTLN